MLGEVVGINTMYLEGGENLNFAIPVNDAKNLLQNLSRLQHLPNEPEPIKTQTQSQDAPEPESQWIAINAATVWRSIDYSGS
jgi:S1-C subfamily serine protease